MNAFVDGLVVLSVVVALALAPRAAARRPGPSGGRPASACAARAAWATPVSYYGVTLLAAMAAFLVTGVVVGGLLDARARQSAVTPQ